VAHTTTKAGFIQTYYALNIISGIVRIIDTGRSKIFKWLKKGNGKFTSYHLIYSILSHSSLSTPVLENPIMRILIGMIETCSGGEVWDIVRQKYS
jgi:hypothetical protein